MAASHDTTHSFISRSHRFLSHLIRRLGLRGRLLLALLPSIVIILMATGYASYKASEEFIDIALERSVKQHTLAISHEMEQHLETCRTDLLLFAQEKMQAQTLRSALEKRLRSGTNSYFELCYIPTTGGTPVLLINDNGNVRQISSSEQATISPNPFLALEKTGNLKAGQVIPSEIVEITYPMPREQQSNLHLKSQVIRFYTYLPGDETSPAGILFLSIDATRLRNILSWYNSTESPLWAFPRSDELRFSYFLDPEGWILFQSGPLAEQNGELATFLARENFSGTLGKPGQPSAFRPNEKHIEYWNAVEAIGNGKNGLDEIFEDKSSNSEVDSFYFSYAPVKFRSNPNASPTYYGGVVFVDRSLLPIVAGYKNLDVMLTMTISSILLISLLIFLFGRILTKPIRALSDKVNELSSLESMEEIDLPYSGYDITRLQTAINNIIRRVKEQVVEIQAKDEAILNVNKRERAPLKRERETLAETELSRIPEIIGLGPAISNMKVNILKAAQVDVDVLVSGETGTGKQLVAEAIHNHSNRSANPFVSINCGALDENLLLDALFGHVKGAFSEAKADRNGAFHEASGGTLFLDEIQSASPKVQQSLLRAIASRKIKPLGSDTELSVDVRIIAATNIDLPTLIQENRFREDLYYRLKVVSITTPPLREHRENIPLLSVYYLMQAEQLAGRGAIDLSKGALSKLISHEWPGNVRELVNCITRAAVMAETDIIQAEEIRLDNDSPLPQEATEHITPKDTAIEDDKQDAEIPAPAEAPRQPSASSEPPLNERQKTAWPAILKSGTITRKKYQEQVGDSLPTRTAIYDLQDFVKRGMLVKTGKGPSTRYELAPQ
ncbi:sigma-54 dependent transcriptional regulator [uncultured Pseudodesulfovibrio sp.]|uniref:sigma-54 dependent transcriptional regulator n=1 Tax=uncultured Pseudodesulfovibrio sp. TaxID=2035858 RepID=UPI0029C97DC1|nr:sigma-54 dependent transcriptional regulator [uncultured Pseudodesulfovibrio sp.]